VQIALDKHIKFGLKSNYNVGESRLCPSVAGNNNSVQHRFTRMIPGFSRLPYCERLKTLGLWSLEERRNTADLIEVLKMVKGLFGIPMESMFELSTTKHLTGHELKLTKQRSKLEVRRHFFTERLVNRWNSLDHLTVNASTVNTFKNGLQRLKQSWTGFFEY